MTEKQEREAWVLPDTNVLLTNPSVLDKFNIVILGCVLRELEKHKSSNRKELAYQSRLATRYLKNRKLDNKESVRFVAGDFDSEEILGSDYHNEYFDNQIVACCYKLSVPLITYDVLLQFKAESFDIPVVCLDDEVEDDVTSYTGIKEMYLKPSTEKDSKFLADIYEDSSLVPLNMVLGEYLLLWNEEKPEYNDEGDLIGYEVIDTFKYDGYQLVKLKYRPTKDMFMGTTKPINVKQRFAFDMMQNKDVVGSLILGNAGSGKDHIQAAHMMEKLQKGEIDKIVFVRNIQGLKDAGETGYLPGTLEDKMSSWIFPLSDQIGGQEALEMLMNSGKIEIQHFESIRGRSFKNCGVYCTEIQSMTDYHAKVLISRIGEGSYLYMNGDVNQSDSDYNKHNSAINTLKKLKGNPMFSVVTLDKTERSDFATLAELL